MRYLLEVRSKAMPGREDEYDAWYENTHMREVLTVPGFEACTRYERVDPEQDGRQFVAVYEVETDDPAQALQTLFGETPRMNLTDSIDPKSVSFQFLRPVGGGRVTAG